jgi:arsenate reductase
MIDSLEQLHVSARLPNRLPLLAERFACEPLRALARLEAGVAVTTPAVLFVCVHNSGRS